MLANPKREMVAKALARGATASDACKQAGYVGMNNTQARQLCDSADIIQRVQEIMEEAESALKDYADNLADMTPEQCRAMLNENWIIKELMVSVKGSQVVGQYAATKSLIELLGKEIGMFGGSGVDKDNNPALTGNKQTVNIVNVLTSLAEIKDMTQEMIDITPSERSKKFGQKQPVLIEADNE